MLVYRPLRRGVASRVVSNGNFMPTCIKFVNITLKYHNLSELGTYIFTLAQHFIGFELQNRRVAFDFSTLLT